MAQQRVNPSQTDFICPSIPPFNPFPSWAVLPINLQGNMGVRCIAESFRINRAMQGGS